MPTEPLQLDESVAKKVVRLCNDYTVVVQEWDADNGDHPVRSGNSSWSRQGRLLSSEAGPYDIVEVIGPQWQEHDDGTVEFVETIRFELPKEVAEKWRVVAFRFPLKGEHYLSQEGEIDCAAFDFKVVPRPILAPRDEEQPEPEVPEWYEWLRRCVDNGDIPRCAEAIKRAGEISGVKVEGVSLGVLGPIVHEQLPDDWTDLAPFWAWLETREGASE